MLLKMFYVRICQEERKRPVGGYALVGANVAFEDEGQV
jgi:hypothetical protein